MSPVAPRPSRRRAASHFDALHSSVDGLQQGFVLGALEAVLVGVHVGQGAHVAVEVLLRDWLLLWYKQQPMATERSRQRDPPAQLCVDEDSPCAAG